MSDESKLLLFYKELESEIADHSLAIGGSGTATLREYAFTDILADELEKFSEVQETLDRAQVVSFTSRLGWR